MNEVNDTTQTLPSLGTVLGPELDRLLAVPSDLQSVKDRLASIEEHCESQGNLAQQSHEKLDGLQQAIEVLCERQECLEHASQRQTMLTEQHYATHIVEPVARQMFSMIHLANQSRSGLTDGNSALGIVQGLHAQMLELLYRFGIEPLEGEKGIRFDPKVMRPVEVRETQDHSKDRTVAESIQIGFRHGDRILLHQKVAIYKYVTNQSDSHVLEERKTQWDLRA